MEKIHSKKWKISSVEHHFPPELLAEFGLTPLMGKLLAKRKITTREEVRLFFQGGRADLPSPFLLPGMEEAVELLFSALERQERILIYGDYDVDGITAVALLLRTLRPFNTGNILYYLPKRLEEGYGLHQQVLAKAVKYGCRLVITADCGITAITEATYLQEKGVRLILTDHHEPGPQLPPAAALLNPKVSSVYPYPQLAGVGVVFKLLQGLAAKRPELENVLWENIDLVALGTIADVVPLLGENRILVKEGLRQMNNTANTGLKALLAQTGLAGKQLAASHVGYILGPRVNAVGRLGDPTVALRLFLEEDPARARKLATLLETMNQKRQRVEEKVQQEAEALIAQSPAVDKALVLAGAWHPGVIGIVANRLADKYYRPTVLLSLEGERARGSGRSIPGFHLFKALEECADCLIKYGGHECAAGLELEKNRLAEFKAAFIAVADARLSPELLTPALEVEEDIPVEALTKDLLADLARLTPFGEGNPEPVLVCRDVNLLACYGVGKDAKHLKLKVGKDGASWEAIGFNFGAPTEELEGAKRVDLAFNLELNDWNNQLQLVLKDLKLAEVS
ncbi:MAG TPA: single-stranded-DNA-specific exonuclease RecJ [Firmicutes bacterium]|nr:single-stranded-DNA-specific exonuclease RecJ [Bacillota bacterium]